MSQKNNFRNSAVKALMATVLFVVLSPGVVITVPAPEGCDGTKFFPLMDRDENSSKRCYPTSLASVGTHAILFLLLSFALFEYGPKMMGM